MGKKINLPVLANAWGARGSDSLKKTKADKKPSLDDARNRLGGRTNEEEPGPPGIGPGSIVQVLANDGTTHIAVVVFANATEIHVLIDGKRLRRVTPAAVEPNAGRTPIALSKIAADAHVFARLGEGHPVRYADDMGGLLAGKLVEKCRYGALVVREDGAVVAVGFRKLWPAATSEAS